MHRIHFKKILVPVDFSKTGHKSFHHVKWLASKFYSEVTLIHIREVLPTVSVFPSLYVPQEDINNEYRKLALEKLEEMRAELIEGGVSVVNIQYSEGAVAACINDYATEEKMDIVVMGTHGSSGLTEFFIGSNAFKVVNMIDLPVLTVNDKGAFAPYKNIIVPLDDSKFSRAKFPYVAELAAILGAEVVILYPIVDDEFRKTTIDKHFQQVSDFLESKGVEHISKPVEGNFGHEIVKFAEYSNADLIVIMSETELTISKMLLGSQAQEIVNHSIVPVITLHPEDKGELMDIFG